MKIKLKDLVAPIDDVIKFHKNQKQDDEKNTSAEYKKGFLKGLQMAKETLKETWETIKENP